MTKVSFMLPKQLRRRLDRYQRRHVELRTRTSVLLKAANGRYLVVGDAAWHERHWAEPVPKGGMTRLLLEDDPKAAMLALERIHAWALAEPEVQILAGHEATLEQRYPLYPDALVPDGPR